MTWIKWWKDKTFMTILAITLATMVVAFLLTYFITWGWIPAIAMAVGGGLLIRRVFAKRMDEVADNERTYITAIKGVNVNESDWREATAEEKEEFEKAQEEARKTSETDEE